MITHQKMASITLVILSMCLTNIAFANGCYEKSPQLVALADTYYDLEKTQALTSDDLNQLASFLDQLSGQWEGDSASMQCAGTEKAPRVNHTSATITADAKMLPNGKLRIRASKFDTRGNINRGERLDLIDMVHVFDFTLTDDKQLTFSERFRRNNTNQSSRLTEVLYDIQLMSNVLTLKRRYYTNGVLTGSETWMLNPH